LGERQKMKDHEKEKIVDFLEDIEENPLLEKYRKQVLMKYIEYNIILVQRYIDERKTLSDLLDFAKDVLWFTKNKQVEEIEQEIGAHN